MKHPLLLFSTLCSGFLLLCSIGAQAQWTPPAAAESIMIILDASSSMEGRLANGESKMAAAKRVILDVLKNVPPSVQVGLRVYGQSDNAFTACRATAQLVPMGTGNRTLIASKLVGIRPTGATPISHAIRTAINQDFSGLPGKKSIVLVSDGQETCDMDPCRLAVEMVRTGIDVSINVVGFGLQDLSAIRQLKCVALSTYGKYYQADTAAQLAESMTQALKAETLVEGKVLLPNALPAPLLTSPPQNTSTLRPLPNFPALKAPPPVRRNR